MKRFALVVVVLGVGALLVPILNLVMGAPEVKIKTAEAADPELAALAPTFEKKCLNCHSSEGKLPFYASLPPAKGMIARDIELGTRSVDLLEGLSTTADAIVG